MVFETLSLSVIAFLLFLLLLTRKKKPQKVFLGLLTAAASVAAMVYFLMMQRSNGNPDAGKEFIQLYLPCGAYLFLTLWGLLSAAVNYRRIRKDRAAKKALKESSKKKAKDSFPES